jgi:predicted nuclease of predicted toxin-antitoxin system
MRLLIDMNLSPQWIPVFERQGWQAVHWSSVGDARAIDRVIMDWARENSHVIFTHDLDFGTLLAVTQAGGPSVIQIRAQDIMPKHLEKIVIRVLKEYTALLESGALITVDESTSRARILPLIRKI